MVREGADPAKYVPESAELPPPLDSRARLPGEETEAVKFNLKQCPDGLKKFWAEKVQQIGVEKEMWKEDP